VTHFPEHDPDRNSTLEDLMDTSPDTSPSLPIPPYHPYLTRSLFLLGEWYWNNGAKKSQSSCKVTSICFLTSPLLPYSPLVHMYFPHTPVPSLGTTPKADDFHIQSPTTFQMSTHWLSAPFSAHTSTASDEPQTHWDMSMWHYGTLCCHVDGY
jgi:hypothetical protein